MQDCVGRIPAIVSTRPCSGAPTRAVCHTACHSDNVSRTRCEYSVYFHSLLKRPAAHLTGMRHSRLPEPSDDGSDNIAQQPTFHLLTRIDSYCGNFVGWAMPLHRRSRRREPDMHASGRRQCAGGEQRYPVMASPDRDTRRRDIAERTSTSWRGRGPLFLEHRVDCGLSTFFPVGA